MAAENSSDDYLIAPDPGRARLTRAVTGVDQTGAAAEIAGGDAFWSGMFRGRLAPDCSK